MKKLLFPTLCLGLMLCCLACSGKKQNVSLRLTPTERNRIDTLYTSRLDSLRPIWDSLCDDRYAKMVKVAVDSIVAQRLEEEERLRARTTTN